MINGRNPEEEWPLPREPRERPCAQAETGDWHVAVWRRHCVRDHARLELERRLQADL